MKDFNFLGEDGLVDALLVEVAGLLSLLIENGEEGAIDLLGLPLSPAAIGMLDQRLGRGEVEARIHACGLSEIRETSFPGVWWTQHADEDGRVIARLIEVSFVPTLLQANIEDIKRGQEALLNSISATRKTKRSAA
jgi:hydrogenase-1 operon protein HyaF